MVCYRFNTIRFVTGIFALANRETDKMYFIVAYILVGIFWFLESHYLLQERLFRSLYGKIRKLSEDKIDFDMNTIRNEFKTGKNTFCSCLVSLTEAVFYVPLAIISTGVIILTNKF